jgi:hypothetical protein
MLFSCKKNGNKMKIPPESFFGEGVKKLLEERNNS